MKKLTRDDLHNIIEYPSEKESSIKTALGIIILTSTVIMVIFTRCEVLRRLHKREVEMKKYVKDYPNNKKLTWEDQIKEVKKNNEN